MGNKVHSNPKWATMAVNRCEKLFPGPLKVLDVGTRDGFCRDLFIKKGYDCVGTDIEPQGPGIIKDDFNHTKLQVKVDLIFARHVIEHCDDVGSFLITCKKLLTPGGRLFIVFPLQSKREPGVKHKVFIETMDDFRSYTEALKIQELRFHKMRKKGRTGKYDEVYYAGKFTSGV